MGFRRLASTFHKNIPGCQSCANYAQYIDVSFRNCPQEEFEMDTFESELLEAKTTEKELLSEKNATECTRVQEDEEVKRKKEAEDVEWQERLDELDKRMDVSLTIDHTNN